MRRKSINGIDVIISYDQRKNKYLVICILDYNFFTYYIDEKPTTDQEIEDMENELEQIRLDSEYLNNILNNNLKI